MANENTPLDAEAFFYLAELPEAYTLLFALPLFRCVLNPMPALFDFSIGQQRFVACVDCPIYLLPMDSRHCEKYGQKKVELPLYPNGDKPLDLDLKDSVTVYFEFTKGIEPYFYYKIETDGTLYKKEFNKWIPIPKPA